MAKTYNDRKKFITKNGWRANYDIQYKGETSPINKLQDRFFLEGCTASRCRCMDCSNYRTRKFRGLIEASDLDIKMVMDGFDPINDSPPIKKRGRVNFEMTGEDGDLFNLLSEYIYSSGFKSKTPFRIMYKGDRIYSPDQNAFVPKQLRMDLHRDYVIHKKDVPKKENTCVHSWESTIDPKVLSCKYCACKKINSLDYIPRFYPRLNLYSYEL